MADGLGAGPSASAALPHLALAGYRSLPPDLMAGGGPEQVGRNSSWWRSPQRRSTSTSRPTSVMTIDPATSHRLADELWWQLEQNPPMLGLSQTPLLLTLICLAFAHAGQGRKLRLPVTRCELYAECLEGFLGRWPHVRRDGWESGLTREKQQVSCPQAGFAGRDGLAVVRHQSRQNPVHPIRNRRNPSKEQPCLAILQKLVDGGVGGSRGGC